MANALINQTLENGVSIITLNRAEKFHSFNTEMAKQLQVALKEAENNSQVRAVLLTATGKAFCAGQDLAEAINPNGPGIKKIVGENYNPIIRSMRKMEKPIVCAVNGVAAGAGANLALAGDIVVAARSATFIQAFIKIGLIPDSAGTFILPRLVGWQRATALSMLGDKVTAEEAVQMGMIYKVFDDDKLEPEAKQLAKTLAELPTKGLGMTKRLLNESFYNSLDKQLDRELDVQAEAASTADYKEGVKAFLEKRKPVFKGE